MVFILINKNAYCDEKIMVMTVAPCPCCHFSTVNEWAPQTFFNHSYAAFWYFFYYVITVLPVITVTWSDLTVVMPLLYRGQSHLTEVIPPLLILTDIMQIITYCMVDLWGHLPWWTDTMIHTACLLLEVCNPSVCLQWYRQFCRVLAQLI